MSDESTFLEAYRADAYARPSVTVDLVLFTVRDADLKVLLIERAGHPFEGRPALPGGFLRVSDDPNDRGESLDEAAARELAEETGLRVTDHRIYLRQLAAFGAPQRDPRTRVISIAYFALVPSDLMPFVQAGSDARDAWWQSLHALDPDTLAFDHAQIIDTARQRLQQVLDITPAPFHLLPETFTVSELRAVHEAVHGQTYDASNFRRKFKKQVDAGQIEQAEGRRLQDRGKPAKVYRKA